MLEQLDTVLAFAVVMLLLSLLVTTMVQMVIAVLGLRGRYLLDGTEQLLKQLYPDLKDQARSLAEKVLTHPAVSVRRPNVPKWLGGGLMRSPLAVAIRPKELILVLEDLADNDPDLGTAKEKIKELFTRSVGQGSPEMVAKAEELLQKLEAHFPGQAQDLRASVEGVLGTTQGIVVKVDAWFDTVMDRTSEVFKIRSRWITAAIAIVFAWVLHIDTLALLHQISQDGDLRARLVQMSGVVEEEGEKVLAAEGAPLATRSLQQLAQDTAQPDVAQPLMALCSGGDPLQCFQGLSTRADGERWIGRNLQEPVKPKVLAAYGETFNQVSTQYLEDRFASFKRLQGHLDDTGLDIIPSPIPGLFEFKDGRNFLGIVMTAFFLSLGAPFWYNTLRKLSDLRPIVARRVEGEPLKGAPKPERS